MLAALDRLNESVGAVVTRISDTEYRARRDISYAQDAAAAQESAAFVLEHMPKARVFWEPPTLCGSRSARSRGRGWPSSSGWRPAATLKIIADAVGR